MRGLIIALAIWLGAAGSSQAADTVYVLASSLNCRLSPSPNAEVVARLAQGETVERVERGEAWSRVETARGALCWAATRYLAADAPSEGLSQYSRTRASSPRASRPRASSGHSTGTASGLMSPAPRKTRRARTSSYYDAGGCPCSGARICIGPRGGRYCITSGGNKRYGV